MSLTTNSSIKTAKEIYIFTFVIKIWFRNKFMCGLRCVWVTFLLLGEKSLFQYQKVEIKAIQIRHRSRIGDLNGKPRRI